MNKADCVLAEFKSLDTCALLIMVRPGVTDSGKIQELYRKNFYHRAGEPIVQQVPLTHHTYCYNSTQSGN